MRAALPPRVARNIRRVHTTFTTLYTVITGFFIGGLIWFINYELIFQAALLFFATGIGFLMISMLLIGKEICLTRGEFYLLNRHIIVIILCAIASILLTSFYVWNIVNILLRCGHSHIPHLGALASIASVENALHATTVEEDQAFQLARAAKVCRNEQGFGIFLTTLLIIIDILNFVTIGVYLWIRSWLRCLP